MKSQDVMQRRVSTVISQDAVGQPLIDYLCRRFNYLDRSEWLEHIRLSRVVMNDQNVSPETPLVEADRLSFDMSYLPEPPVNANFSCIYEDEDLLVIDKPGNLPCHPGGRYFQHSLWYLLKTRWRDETIHLVNRLDRETSGLVLVAKNAAIARACQRQFEDGQVRKRYEVWVEGEVFPDMLLAEGYLVSDSTSRIRKKRRFMPLQNTGPAPSGAKACHIVFSIKDRSNGISRLTAVPTTGATHQIRAALNGLGYAVVGDKIYGLDETAFTRFITGALTDADRRLLRLPRQALHAARLEMHHPRYPEPMVFNAPLPADMEKLPGGPPNG